MQAYVDVDRDPAAALVIRADATKRELSTVTCARGAPAAGDAPTSRLPPSPKCA